MELSGIDLPDGYSVQRVFVWDDSTAHLFISDTDVPVGSVVTESKLSDIIAKPNEDGGVKIMLIVDTEMIPSACIDPHLDLFEFLSRRGDVLDLDGSRVVSRPSAGYHDLEWFTELAHYRLKAIQEFSLDELAEIVGSEG